MLCEARGQSSVEAALLVPVVSLVLALMVQPLCLLLTRVVMWDAAAETARAAATSSDEDACVSFARRRLAGVPEASLFHEGDWDVAVDGLGGAAPGVTITGHARPLPFLGTVASWTGLADEQGIVLSVSVREQARPSWLEGSYASWIGIWG